MAPKRKNRSATASDAANQTNEEPPLKQAKLDTMIDKAEDGPAQKSDQDESDQDLSLPNKVEDEKLDEAKETLDQMEEVISHGRIYFLYKSKVDVDTPHSIDDVAKLHIILKPEGSDDDQMKLIIVGRKYLPDPKESRQPIWAFVKEVTQDHRDLLRHTKESSYSTKTRGERKVSADSVFAEGHYALVVSEGKTPSQTSSHLAYALELPDKVGKVQEAFNLREEGSFGLSIKNPSSSNPPQAGLKESADFPPELISKFEGRRWNPITEIAYLNYTNAELLLLAQKEDIPSQVEEELETLAANDAEHAAKATNVISARIYEDLRAKKSQKDVQVGAVTGEWD